MSQSLSNVLVHIVFSTKDRKPFLRNPDIRNQMFAQLGAASKTLNCQPIIVGGVEDHIHMLARQARTIALSEWVKEVKRVTSIWIKESSRKHEAFAWQSGYGAFSVRPITIKESNRLYTESGRTSSIARFQNRVQTVVRTSSN